MTSQQDIIYARSDITVGTDEIMPPIGDATTNYNDVMPVMINVTAGIADIIG